MERLSHVLLLWLILAAFHHKNSHAWISRPCPPGNRSIRSSSATSHTNTRTFGRLSTHVVDHNGADDDQNAASKPETLTKHRIRPPKDRAKSRRRTAKRRMEQTILSSFCVDQTASTAVPHPLPQDIVVLGVDEAGRGALAGPLVCAAVQGVHDLHGLQDMRDSKGWSAGQRHRVADELFAPQMNCDGDSHPNKPFRTATAWAVAVVQVHDIDTYNVLQATLRGMQQSITALVNPAALEWPLISLPSDQGWRNITAACAAKKDWLKQSSFVVARSSGAPATDARSSVTDDRHRASTINITNSRNETTTDYYYYALIDGPHLPQNLPCPARPVVRGDGKEFLMAAASVLAKVVRDSLLVEEYHPRYPSYDLQRHKGYPTAAHRAALEEYGPSPIHRRTFAPVRNMLREEGR